MSAIIDCNSNLYLLDLECICGLNLKKISDRVVIEKYMKRIS